MAELGLDLSAELPKPLTGDDAVEAADVVGKRYLDWDLADPAGKDVAEVRAIRDEIDARVQALLADLLG